MENLNRANALLCIMLFLFLPHLHSYGQQDSISITAEIVSVTRSARFKPKCRNMSRRDTIPSVISFEFVIENKTEKNMIFGSNTRDYYWNQEYFHYSNSNYGIIGRFLLINKSDTIVLFTDQYNLVPDPDEDIVIWGSVDYSVKDPASTNLLCYFAQFRDTYKEKIYNYLKDCELIYVPVISDYERKLAKLSVEERESLIFPQKIIHVKKKDPFMVLFGKYRDDYEVYPPIKKKWVQKE